MQFERSLDQMLSDLPAATLLDRTRPRQDISCVVAIVGFEPRCYAAVDRMASSGWHAAAGICVCYDETNIRAPNELHRADLVDRMLALTYDDVPLILEHNDHSVEVDFGETLLHGLKTRGIDVSDPSTHIVFDITVGSSRLLLEGLHALLQQYCSVTLTYSEASKYRPDFSEFIEHVAERRVHSIEAPEFLTRGVERVEVLRRIPGSNADARPAYLVLFPSFAYTRSSAVIDELAPSRVQWMFGIPHLVENRWRLDAQREYHRGLVERSHRHCYVSTFDYRETLEVLERTYRKRRSDYGVVVASLGSKMQKVGQVLFHLLRPEAAAVVSIPRTWDPDRFSSDAPRAVYTINFGPCDKLRELLWSSRRLRI
jgi:hypothetical protein